MAAATTYGEANRKRDGEGNGAGAAGGVAEVLGEVRASRFGKGWWRGRCAGRYGDFSVHDGITEELYWCDDGTGTWLVGADTFETYGRADMDSKYDARYDDRAQGC